MSIWQLSACAIVVEVALAIAPATAADHGTVLDGFAAAVANSPTATVQQKALVAELIRQMRKSPEERSVAITESLRLLHPEFKSALAALGQGQLDEAIRELTPLRESADAYLAADASFYLARAYLLGERFEEALPLLAELQGKWADKTVSGGEVLFLRGVAEAALLRHSEAIATLEKFLASHPDAAERLRAGAARQLERLKQYQAGTLSDVHQRMDFSRRKLTQEDTGSKTREQQEKIIDLLAQLIKASEKREANGQGSSGAGQAKQQGQAGETQGQQPREGNQNGNSGGRSQGTDSDTVERLHRGGPRSPWSRLRDKERDPVYSAIKEKFPARYQQLLEQYYKSFQDEEK